jgi:hypothetical protein
MYKEQKKMKIKTYIHCPVCGMLVSVEKLKKIVDQKIVRPQVKIKCQAITSKGTGKIINIWGTPTYENSEEGRKIIHNIKKLLRNVLILINRYLLLGDLPVILQENPLKHSITQKIPVSIVKHIPVVIKRPITRNIIKPLKITFFKEEKL